MGRRTLLSCLLLLLVVSPALLSETPFWANKIKHVVVLMEENRSFDQMFGWYPGVNGLTGKEWNPVSTEKPSPHIYVNKEGPMIAPCDPDHGTNATTFKIFGAASASKGEFKNASMIGFVEWENLRGNERTNYCDVMSTLTPKDLPVLSTLASEYALMDRFFASHAGPTWPNRLYMLSATSAGLTSTGPWYQDKPGHLFPQETFFDQLTKANLTWRNYYNDTPWELFLASMAHNPEHLQPMEQFFKDCKEGTLPAYSWINPRNAINVTSGLGSNDQHPDHDIALGEAYYKDIYEALRASPLWEELLFVITYDEHGGFFDHVPTPLNVPPPDHDKSFPEKGVLFNRLGVRLPTLLISPWIPKGLVISAPPEAQKPFPNSEYELTSIMATTRKILGMKNTPPLTKRDAWSATFEQALALTTPRKDCPIHLPPAPPPSRLFSPEKESAMPINDLQTHVLTVHAHLGSGSADIRHVRNQGQVGHWAQRYLKNHSHQTRQWKDSKLRSEFSVAVGPFQDDWVSVAWNVNKDSSVAWNTISVRKLSPEFCLDYRSAQSTNQTMKTMLWMRQAPRAGDVVGVSHCYPSAKPDTNRDPAQQWIWENDSTVRPAADRSLCLTTDVLDKAEQRGTVFLLKCDGRVEQYWSYDGPAPGGGNGGSISFGVTGLGIVRA